MRSIRRQLLVWLLALVLLGVGIAGWLIYRQALAEANELFDYQLEQIAAALPSEPFSQVLGSRDAGDEGIVLQIWNRNGVLMYYSRPRAPLAPRAELGFSTERHRSRRLARVWARSSAITSCSWRSRCRCATALAADVALRTLWPLIVLLPLLGLAVWVIVGRGLRAAAARDERARHASSGGARTVARSAAAARGAAARARVERAACSGSPPRSTSQKAFVADAAHELRTPLAAVQIQAQLVARAKDDAARSEALADLQAGVTRATRLAEQLLALARSEPDGAAVDRRRRLARVAARVRARLMRRLRKIAASISASRRARRLP